MAVAVHIQRQAGLEAVAGFGQDPEATVGRAVRRTLADRDVREGTLSITLMDDAGIAAMNGEWKGRSSPTDVLAFPLHDEGEPVTGDVYLGVERAAAQAAELGEAPDRELARIAVHGTLHVLGFEHPEEGREESEMWRHQERIVAELHAE